MKKILIVGGMVLLFTFVVLISCATVPVKPVTQADLPDLKGKWKGFYESRGGTYTQAVELEISNEQLNGSWTWNHANRSPDTFPFYGKIENGRIVNSWPSGQVNLSLRRGEGKMKLEGNYQIEGYQGTMYLDKVK